MKPSPKAPEVQEDAAAEYEATHVHQVYDAIASHFSSTRHKPWPLVQQFLALQDAGALGLDVGCGNGKYFDSRPMAAREKDEDSASPDGGVFVLGMDRSLELGKLAWKRSRGHSDDHIAISTQNANTNTSANSANTNTPSSTPSQTSTEPTSKPINGASDFIQADSLALPFRDGVADFILCIAVVHHLATRERRIEAVRELLRCVRPRPVTQPSLEGQNAVAPTQIEDTSTLLEEPLSLADQITLARIHETPHSRHGGQVLVYVWALEQGNSRRGWEEGGEQDLLVPWVLKQKQQKQRKQKKPKQRKNKTSEVEAEKEKTDNATGSLARRTQDSHHGKNDTETHLEQPLAATSVTPNDNQTAEVTLPTPESTTTSIEADEPTYQRFYHLYRQGELEEDIVQAGGRVLASGYEKDNWWVVCDREELVG